MKFGIFRIIGNELFPRDKKGDRFNVIKSIINIEPDFDNCQKIWVLNILTDPKYKTIIVTYLKKHKQTVIDIPFELTDFHKMNNKEKLTYILSINNARNRALEIGREIFDYTILLDGDCFFLQDHWGELMNKLYKIKTLETPKVLSFPTVRIQLKNGKVKKINSFKEEPQLAFHSSSLIKFDETKEYGNGDKVSLLNYLEFKRLNSSSNYYYPTNDSSIEMVEVFHLSKSFMIDKFSEMRKIARKIGVLFIMVNIYFCKYRTQPTYPEHQL